MPFWSRNRSSTRPGRIGPSSGPAAGAQEMFETLESRLALYASPFLADLPTLEMMEHPENTVVRMQMSAGIVDIELYNRFGPGTAPAAPITANNFIRYINNGLMDNTFFHRLVEGFVVQGGGFKFNSVTSRSENVVTYDPIVNEFNEGRSNIARTVAMAKLGSGPDTATSQFFFNLGDNSSNLNTQNGGFTVFGRVIQGWDVITTINGFSVRNLNQFLTGASAGAFDEVPLSGSNNTDLVTIIDVEVIKPANQNEFYSQSVYFPDGYRSGNSTESVEIVNLDPNASSVYQVIARFESGQRDQVIDSGILTPGARTSVQVAKAQVASINRVRGGAPYAIEVRATQSVAASINRTDFGATAGESFVSAAPLSTPTLQSWSFANGQKGPGLGSFLTYQNLSDLPVSVTAVFTAENGSSFLITKIVAPYRRGGLDVNQLPSVPAGVYSVTITSNGPIVSALSQFRAAPGRAATATGQVGGPSTQGVLPAAIIPLSGQSVISVLYSGEATGTVTVNFEFVLSSGTVLTNASPFTLSTTDRRKQLDLSIANGAIPRGQFFTIRYRVQGDLAPVTVGYTSVTDGDTVSTAFQTVSSQELAFADGFTDPSSGATGTEVISLYNPFGDPSVAMDYRISFHFVDGDGDEIFIPAGGSGSIVGGRRVDIPIRTLTDLITRITAGQEYRHYSIRVSANPSGSTSPINGAIFAQLSRFDTAGNTIVTGPTLNATQDAFMVTNPIFLP